ncbi:hypothetical protein ACOMHN_049731 [Nucella lapillus]
MYLYINACVTTGAHAAETRRTAEAQRKRAARKVRATSTSTAVPTHMCPTCGTLAKVASFLFMTSSPEELSSQYDVTGDAPGLPTNPNTRPFGDICRRNEIAVLSLSPVSRSEFA